MLTASLGYSELVATLEEQEGDLQMILGEKEELQAIVDEIVSGDNLSENLDLEQRVALALSHADTDTNMVVMAGNFIKALQEEAVTPQELEILRLDSHPAYVIKLIECVEQLQKENAELKAKQEWQLVMPNKLLDLLEEIRKLLPPMRDGKRPKDFESTLSKVFFLAGELTR